MFRSAITTSRRRRLLDHLLQEHVHLMRGRVLDIGGKKVNKRGTFRPPSEGVEVWEYVNMDADTEPDYLCSAEDISPAGSASYDVAIACELLEHVQNPGQVLSEVSRVLRPDGVAIMSMPFLVNVHGDPADFQRWTRDRWKLELAQAGFRDSVVSPMGDTGVVLHDLLRVAVRRQSKWKRRVGGAALAVMSPLFAAFERWLPTGGLITSGYFVVARKPASGGIAQP